MGHKLYYCPQCVWPVGIMQQPKVPTKCDLGYYNLIQNGVYQFGVFADVAIMNLLFQGDIPLTGSTIMIDNEIIVLYNSYMYVALTKQMATLSPTLRLPLVNHLLLVVLLEDFSH